MSTWGEDTVQRAAAEIRRRRTQLGLSAQALSDRTAELGHTVSRTTISDLELGRRGERLLVPDLIVLAAALYTSPGALMYPDMPHGAVETLPGVLGTSLSSAEWLGRSLSFDLAESDGQWASDSSGVDSEHNALLEAGRKLESELDLLKTSLDALRHADPDHLEVILKSVTRRRDYVRSSAARVRELGGTVDDAKLERLGAVDQDELPYG